MVPHFLPQKSSGKVLILRQNSAKAAKIGKTQHIPLSPDLSAESEWDLWERSCALKIGSFSEAEIARETHDADRASEIPGSSLALSAAPHSVFRGGSAAELRGIASRTWMGFCSRTMSLCPSCDSIAPTPTLSGVVLLQNAIVCPVCAAKVAGF